MRLFLFALLLMVLLLHAQAFARADALQPFQVLARVQAEPLTAHQMARVQGKTVTDLASFLRLSTKTILGPGVFVYAWGSGQAPFAVTATWTTGAVLGTGTWQGSGYAFYP